MLRLKIIVSSILTFYGFSYVPDLPPEEEKLLFDKVEESIKRAEHVAENGASLQEKRDTIRKAKQTLLAAKKRMSGR